MSARSPTAGSAASASRPDSTIARGDFSARVVQTSTEELRRLVDEFYRMAADLQLQRAELERVRKLARGLRPPAEAHPDYEAILRAGLPVLVVSGGHEPGLESLCDAIAESYPPQCPGVSLLVEGLKLEEVDGLQRASGVAWSGRTQLLGVVADGKITVGENVMA